MFYVYINRNISQYVYIGTHHVCVGVCVCGGRILFTHVSARSLYKKEPVAQSWGVQSAHSLQLSVPLGSTSAERSTHLKPCSSRNGSDPVTEQGRSIQSQSFGPDVRHYYAPELLAKLEEALLGMMQFFVFLLSPTSPFRPYRYLFLIDLHTPSLPASGEFNLQLCVYICAFLDREVISRQVHFIYVCVYSRASSSR